MTRTTTLVLMTALALAASPLAAQESTGMPAAMPDETRHDYSTGTLPKGNTPADHSAIENLNRAQLGGNVATTPEEAQANARRNALSVELPDDAK